MIKEYRLSSESLWEEINTDFQDKGGAYKMIYKENGKVRQIGRFLKVDSEGTLCIGKATCYLDRVIGLKKTIDPKYESEPHIGGRRYKKNDNIKIIFPYSNLYVILIEDDNPESKEKELLDQYFQQFGEVPPLNAI
jgi:hypothetical protein